MSPDKPDARDQNRGEIAPRSQLEQDLRNSELSYRRLFEAAQDGILILDVVTGRVDDVNPFLLNLLGYTKSEMMGRTVGELSPFRDAVPNQAVFERLQHDGYVRYDNLPLETKGGQLVEVEFVSNVYQAGSKKLIQCNIRDNTARKHSDKWLALLGISISSLNDIVMITEAEPIDEPGPKIVFLNEAFERVTGYTSAEALGRSPRFLQGDKTDRRIRAEIRDALANGRPIRRQLVNYRKDGTKYWLDIGIVPIFGPAGKCTHFVAVERDVTDEKKNEARFRRLIDSNAQSVIFWNTKGEIVDANDSFLRLLGYTREDLTAGRINWVALTPPQFAHLDRHALDELAAKGTCEPYEKEFIRRDGTTIPIVIGAAMFEDNPDEGVCFVLDLTERRKLENQFHRAQRMESIGTLAGGIAHDLNNILAPIMMAIEMLKAHTDKSPDALRMLETIGVSAKRGADIVRQVLSFARGVDGDRIEVQSKHLLNDLEIILRDTFPRDVQTHFSVPNDIWTILGDPTQIHQILLNLCVNARDAMPNGGSLQVSVQNIELDEHYVAMNIQARAGRYVQISVTDSGSGIPSAILDKIFEPFFTTKEINKSTGLGLSTVMAIVKSHGGLVNVYSEPGKGTTFKIYLPALVASSEERKEQTDQDRLPRGNGETILVVDDESSIVAITSQTLQAFGYRVLTAADGAEAVAVYVKNEGKIALVLTDMMMPVMAGMAMIHALKRINAKVRIVASSGLNRDGNMSETYNPTGRDFLVKPYTAEKLLQTVRAVLNEV